MENNQLHRQTAAETVVSAQPTKHSAINARSGIKHHSFLCLAHIEASVMVNDQWQDTYRRVAAEHAVTAAHLAFLLHPELRESKPFDTTGHLARIEEDRNETALREASLTNSHYYSDLVLKNKGSRAFSPKHFWFWASKAAHFAFEAYPELRDQTGLRPRPFVNDYRLTPEDSARIQCSDPQCDAQATTGQNTGSAPFWYHCDRHAAEQRRMSARRDFDTLYPPRVQAGLTHVSAVPGFAALRRLVEGWNDPAPLPESRVSLSLADSRGYSTHPLDSEEAALALVSSRRAYERRTA